MTTTLSVIGVGYLGAVHAAAMAELGHHVIGLDIDAERVSALQAGVPPFHEPGFEEILARGLASGRGSGSGGVGRVGGLLRSSAISDSKSSTDW